MNFKISHNNENAKINLSEKDLDGVLFVTVNMDFSAETVAKPVKLSWFFSANDCFSIWNPASIDGTGLGYEWGKHSIHSRLASWMPIQSLLSIDGTNKLLVASSDVDTPTRIGMGIREEDATFACDIEFFTSPIAPMTHYEAVIRFDMREIPFCDSVYDATDWWENECGYTPAPVPESARMPMDSLWYSFHQMLSREEILKECAASKELGLDTVIIDDGWQTEDNNRGYAYCGDWQVATSKMGDMAELCRDIHTIGMKVILWYSVPFVGICSEKYEEFKDYFLEGCGNLDNSFALDPRYKKVRDYLVNTYKDAVENWGLDGLKLDFIDSFRLKGKSLEYDSRRDYSSLEDGIHALMTEITQTLRALTPHIMIEFRQSYIGPSIRKYGNMLRVGDCACDTVKNRVGVANLRLTSGKTAVHSDMIMWNINDTAENAALQFTSILYSVPQISMRIDKLPKEHFEMLCHYIDFWKKHRDVLLDGKITALNPETNYSIVASTLGEKSIITAYTNQVVDIKTKEAIVVNATMHGTLVIKNAVGMNYKTTDCKGNLLYSGKITENLEEIQIPTAGIVYLESN